MGWMQRAIRRPHDVAKGHRHFAGPGRPGRRATRSGVSPADNDGVAVIPDEALADSARWQDRLRLRTAAFYLAHPDKDKSEDAFYVADSGRVVALADGVGGWAAEGVDPSAYSARLMDGMKEAFSRRELEDPRLAIALAFEHAKNTLGSSTVCCALLAGATVRVANLGDSGALLLRRPSPDAMPGLVARTKSQQHVFNMPYQLGSQSRDSPADAERVDANAHPEDLLILGTDGLFDNLWISELVPLCAKYWDDPAQLALSLGDYAADVASDQSAFTPFQREANEHGYRFQGGKMDDITVLVSKVELRSSP